MLNRQSLRIIVFAIALLLGLAAGIAQRRSLQKGHSDFLTEWTALITRPFLVTAQSAARESEAFTGIFRTNAALKRENAGMRSALIRARRELHTAGEDKAEAERLSKLLDIKENLPLKTIAATVLIRPATPWAETCMLGRGSADGVRPGAAVLAAGGLVGQVWQVNRHTCEVLLLRDRKNAVACLTERTRAPGICSGQGTEYLSMDYLPLHADVKPGDVVMSSGEGSVYPKGLIVGIVTGIEPGGPMHFKRATVHPAVEFRSVEEVLIVVGQK